MDKDNHRVAVLERQGSDVSDGSGKSSLSIKSPRTARFAEATSVVSPVEPSDASRAPFSSERRTSSEHLAPQPQPADIGFGYIGDRASQHSAQIGQAVEMPLTPRSPLKSALRSPGAPPRNIPAPSLMSPTSILSPTWKEEDDLEKQEEKTEKEQQRDVRIKARVRIAKIFLRGTNLSCSLIVLSMMSSTFAIFNATHEIPTRNNLPPWATNTTKWPAILLLCISCVSLAMSVVILWNHWRRSHRRAEKAGVYYTVFAMGFFVFNTVMWVIAAVALDSQKNNPAGTDIWGWSCKDNERKQLFQNVVNYDLVCRLQNWGLVCALIEVVVELITILIYATVFYRFFSKRRLRKSMAHRDAARSDLYLAQLRSQSAPNTPGLASPRFGPLSPREGGYNPMFSPRYQNFAAAEKQPVATEEPVVPQEGVRYINAPTQSAFQQPKEFKLASPPPKRNTPKLNQDGFETPRTPASPSSLATPRTENAPVHHPAAPGEKQYDSVPIPGAYSSPINSPTHPPNTAQAEFFQHL